MVNSIEGENSVAAGEKKKELVPPVFATDLAPNVRAVLIVRAILLCGVMPH
jgi:hypothetical protein